MNQVLKCPKCNKMLKWDKDKTKSQYKARKGVIDEGRVFIICKFCKHLDDAIAFSTVEKKRRIPKLKEDTTPR